MRTVTPIAWIPLALVCLYPGTGALAAQGWVRQVLVDGQRHQLSTIGSIIPLDDGRVVIGQPQDLRVLIASGGGDSLRPVGRGGEGPGEFRAVSGMGRHGGGFWVADRPRRITLFDSDGRLLTVQPWPRIDGLPGSLAMGLASVLGWSPSGSILLHGVIRRAPGEPGAPARAAGGELLVSVQSDGGSRILARLATSPRCPVRGRVNSPFCPKAYRAVSPNGEWVVTVDPVLGDPIGVPVRIGLINASGDSVYTGVHSFPTRHVTRADIDSVVARLGALPGTSVDFLEAIRRGPHPTWMASVNAAVVTNEGQVWVKVQGTGPSVSSWVVLGSGGADSSRVDFPASLSLRAIDAGYAIGVESNDLGIESIVRYHIGNHLQ